MIAEAAFRNPRFEIRDLRTVDLGLVPYEECWDLQNKIASEIASGHVPETLLLLEHPHTYTCGRSGGRDHILIGDEELQREGITVLDVDRGGDVTYHGPGQLVAYPIINLHNYGQRIDYPGYVRTLERVLLNTLEELGVEAHQVKGYSGAWAHGPTGEEKIAAIGVRVDGRGITTHGIALNVTTDLRFFSYIVPCGIAGKGVTSLSRMLGAVPPMFVVKDAFARQFAELFGFALPSSGDA
ncbi:MAG: lipoyl(octanoyl) transferase LipB [Chloroflexia bacterium]